MSQPQSQDQVTRVAAILKKSKSILFITGAGISADSGLPTYRGVGGLYHQKETEEGIPIEMALSGKMLAERPEITWKYLSQIEKNCRLARFNRAHEIIALAEKKFERVWVLTQNIDGFHHQAGSRNVIDIHGDMHRLLCMSCDWHDTVADYSRLKIPPPCPRCAGVARPDVVFFGELLPQDKLNILRDELNKGFDIYFSIGTTSGFAYIQQPMIDARYRGRPTVEINPENSEISNLVDIRLEERAVKALEDIWQRL